MSDKAKNIIDELCTNLPKLNDEQQIHVLGVLEGMSIMAGQQISPAPAPQPPAQRREA